MAIESGASPQVVALDHQAGSLSNRCNVQQVQGNKVYGECSDMFSITISIQLSFQNVNLCLVCVCDFMCGLHTD